MGNVLLLIRHKYGEANTLQPLPALLLPSDLPPINTTIKNSCDTAIRLAYGKISRSQSYKDNFFFLLCPGVASRRLKVKSHKFQVSTMKMFILSKFSLSGETKEQTQ